MHVPFRPALRTAILLGVALAWLAPAGACDTPVYRFAMYSQRWTPWPYFVFYIHPGEEAEADAQVNARLRELMEAEPERTNVYLEKVDASQEDAFERLPPAVGELWKERENSDEPVHLVYTPRQQRLFDGRLKLQDVAAMIDSPARKKINDLLSQGKLVFVVLEGKDAKENEQAQKTVAEVATRAASGDLLAGPLTPEALAPPVDPPTDAAEGDAPEENAPRQDEGLKIEVEAVRVSPDDPREEWFVKMLMAVENDLSDFEGQTMVFAAYGQGRVLEPYIGKGITADNLIYQQGLLFLSGPCSCEVKELNPGADLLTTYNWERAAMNLAVKFGEEEGNERFQGVGDLVPTIPTPSESTEDDAPPNEEDAAVQTAEPKSSQPAEATTVAMAETAEATAARSETASATAATSESSHSDGQYGARLARNLGIGVGVVLLLLVVASLTFFRPGG